MKPQNCKLVILILGLVGCHTVAIPNEPAENDPPSETPATTESSGNVIEVRTETVLRKIPETPLGINYNYLRDNPALRPSGSASFDDTVKEMGPRWIRYPGGEKADWHFFAPPPFVKPAPKAIGRYAQYMKIPLDFDQYMASVQKVGAHPYIVVAYETFESSGIREEEYLAHAVGWVKYANITRKYGVKYWEIGNENWGNLKITQNSAEKMAEVVKRFSRAMKKVDPTIKIGSSITGRWGTTLLKNAGSDLDFLSYSMYYNSKVGYLDYQSGRHPIKTGAKAYADAIAKAGYAGKVELIAAEFGATDFRKDIPMEQRWEGNDLGHAIVIFDIAGHVLCERELSFAMFWTTRFMDDMVANRRCYALGPKNEIMPVGMPFVIWNKFLRKQMVAASSPAGCQSYASLDPATGRLSLLIINKGPVAKKVALSIDKNAAFTKCERYQFTGKEPADTHPVFSKVSTSPLQGNEMREVELPGTSVTIFDMTRI